MPGAFDALIAADPKGRGLDEMGFASQGGPSHHDKQTRRQYGGNPNLALNRSKSDFWTMFPNFTLRANLENQGASKKH
jgi:hypothetical protein